MHTSRDSDICGSCRFEKHVHYLCLSCDIYLCKTCEPAHRKKEVEFEHDIENVKGKPGIREIIPVSCSDHTSEKYILRCMTCKHLVCKLCIADKHNQHKFESFNEDVRKNLQKCLQEMENIWLKKLKSGLDPEKQSEIYCDQYFESLKKDVLNRKKAIKAHIDDIVCDLIKTIEDKQTQNKQFYNDLRTKIREELYTIRGDINKIKRAIIVEQRKSDICLEKMMEKHKKIIEEMERLSLDRKHPKFSYQENVDRAYMEKLFGAVTDEDEEIYKYTDMEGSIQRGKDFTYASKTSGDLKNDREVQNKPKRSGTLRKKEQDLRLLRYTKDNSNGCKQQ